MILLSNSTGSRQSSSSLCFICSIFSKYLWACQHPKPNVDAHKEEKKIFPPVDRAGGGTDILLNYNSVFDAHVAIRAQQIDGCNIG
mmetsp:Transcript_15305/g.28824  ORF Transcript_15305/g.28824 Transcript_15305/m.28824 type:complete len:86 (-) Transcript_15305:65-322(-)